MVRLRRRAPHLICEAARLAQLKRFSVFQFGEGSYGKHQDEAARLGVDAMTAMALGTSFDLDTAADLQELDAMRSTPGAGRAAR